MGSQFPWKSQGTQPRMFIYSGDLNGGGERKQGGVGFARILRVSTQLFGSATEKQRDKRRPGTARAREVKSGALRAK